MNDTVETVTVVRNGQSVRINKCDYNSKEDTLAGEKKLTKAEQKALDEAADAAAKVAAANADSAGSNLGNPAPKLSVQKLNKKGNKVVFIVVNEDNTPINDIEYATEAEAITVAFPAAA